MLLNNDNYFSQEANQRYMSCSQYLQFTRCPAAAMAEIKGEYQRPDTAALLHGQYIDAYISGELDDFLADNPKLISSRGATKGQLKAEYRDLQRVIDRFESDKFFMDHLQGDKQVIVTGRIGQADFKGKIDILHADRIVDFKAVRDFADIWDQAKSLRVPFVEYWGYDVQAAIYQELIRQTTGERRPVFIAAVTKEPVPDLAVLSIPDEVLEVKLQEITYWSGAFAEIKSSSQPAERCGKCDYCKSTKVLTEAIPYYEVNK